MAVMVMVTVVTATGLLAISSPSEFSSSSSASLSSGPPQAVLFALNCSPVGAPPWATSTGTSLLRGRLPPAAPRLTSGLPMGSSALCTLLTGPGAFYHHGPLALSSRSRRGCPVPCDLPRASPAPSLAWAELVTGRIRGQREWADGLTSNESVGLCFSDLLDKEGRKEGRKRKGGRRAGRTLEHREGEMNLGAKAAPSPSPSPALSHQR